MCFSRPVITTTSDNSSARKHHNDYSNTSYVACLRAMPRPATRRLRGQCLGINLTQNFADLPRVCFSPPVCCRGSMRMRSAVLNIARCLRLNLISLQIPCQGPVASPLASASCSSDDIARTCAKRWFLDSYNQGWPLRVAPSLPLHRFTGRARALVRGFVNLCYFRQVSLHLMSS